LVTDNADIPTIFEYILGIAWYVLSERDGEILEYMNLSLDADLMPKSHAGGGEADIVYKYNATEKYPAHTLLIEATLSESGTQRRMEMEPVSRHLGDYQLFHLGETAYCVFVATFLHVNVIQDFLNRRSAPYYSSDGETHIEGMKIVPLATSELRRLLSENIVYSDLYDVFDNAYNNNEFNGRDWYENNMVREIEEITYNV
jgi:hypothetical protein